MATVPDSVETLPKISIA